MKEPQRNHNHSTPELSFLETPILDSIHDFAIFTTDSHGIIQRWNPGAERIFGYSAQEICGKNYDVLFTRENREEGVPVEQTIIALQRACSSTERWFLHKDGTRFFASGSIMPVRDAKRGFHGLVHVVRDITERKLGEQMLQRHAERLETAEAALANANAALSEANAQLAEHAQHLEHTVAARTAALTESLAELESFSYSLSHDMRAPLRAMRSYAEMVLQKFGILLPSDGNDYLQRIGLSAERLDQLITDVLDYHRLIRENLRLQPIDTEAVLRRIIAQRPDLQSPRTQVDIRSPLFPVLAHEGALFQCFSNLLENAAKFVQDRIQPRITIWTELASQPTPLVRICIRDNGIGIPNEAAERIFGLFQRLHRNEKIYPGTGVGLTIVRKAVQKMGGVVGFESEPGKGSLFWVQLPHPPDSTPLGQGNCESKFHPQIG